MSPVWTSERSTVVGNKSIIRRVQDPCKRGGTWMQNYKLLLLHGIPQKNALNIKKNWTSQKKCDDYKAKIF